MCRFGVDDRGQLAGLKQMCFTPSSDVNLMRDGRSSRDVILAALETCSSDYRYPPKLVCMPTVHPSPLAQNRKGYVRLETRYELSYLPLLSERCCSVDFRVFRATLGYNPLISVCSTQGTFEISKGGFVSGNEV